MILWVITIFDVIKGSHGRELFLPEPPMTAMSMDLPLVALLKISHAADNGHWWIIGNAALCGKFGAQRKICPTTAHCYKKTSSVYVSASGIDIYK